jgi:hypothetical protein
LTIQTSTQIRIQAHGGFWYTAEDTNFDVGCEGFTVSYWESDKEEGGKRIQHICMTEEEALALADAIYKLFKKGN